MENENDITKKLDFYLEEKIMCHVTLKNKRFLNVRILLKKNAEVYLVEERMYGRMHLFVSDVYEVKEFMEGKDEMGNL